MARPSNNFESLTMTIAISPQIRMYLKDLTLKGTYGCSAAEAARMVLSKAIDDLVDRGSLQHRQFALKDNQVVAVEN